MKKSKSKQKLIRKPWWKSPSISVNWKAVKRLIFSLMGLGLAWLLSRSRSIGHQFDNEVNRCHQTAPLIPTRNIALWEELNRKVESSELKAYAIESLQKAVQIRTESFDNMRGIGEDLRWDVFHQFRAYLEHRFRLVNSHLELTPVNTHGLFYQWKGRDPSLKPILLAAHQDVVPVENSTLDLWAHPPFDGHYDGKRIWGRGTSDDKSQLISILSSIELLLQTGYQPTRTILLAFGFDEEAGGFHGAQYLAEHIKSVYGQDGIAMIVDEGAGFYNIFGAVLAIPGITEKGLYNVRIEVSGPGGHSSMPPPETTISLLANILTELDDKDERLRISGNHPISSNFQCLIPKVKILPKMLQPLLRFAAFSLRFQFARDAVTWWLSDLTLLRSMAHTTQAVDVIHGGIKSNALPETAWAIVNHRVSVTSSLSAVQERYERVLEPLARKYGMSFEAFENQVLTRGKSPYSLKVANATLRGVEPAPFTPHGTDALPYQLLSGTIKSTYNAHRHLGNAEEVTVAPGMMTGNTDTRYYWDLSKHIFRYNHHFGGTKPDPSANGIHTVNEFIEVDVLIESIRFFFTLILNGDESKL